MRVNSLTPQDLKAYGINDVQEIVHNPSFDTLYQEELDPKLEGYERGVLTNLGAIAVDTGIFTGRSPKDKYIVRDDTTRDTVWWSDKGNGKNQTEKEQGQSPQENNGNNGKVKATMMQIRYLKDLCKNLDIKPAVDLAGLSSEKASRYISDLEKMRKLAVKV